MSPNVYPWCKNEYLQDWPTWLANGWTDYVFPQVYRYTLAAYTSALDNSALKWVAKDDLHKFYPGILIKLDDWIIDETFLQGIFAANRERGVQGEVSFFYEGLKDSTVF